MIATAHATEFYVKFSALYSIERCVLWQWYSVLCVVFDMLCCFVFTVFVDHFWIVLKIFGVLLFKDVVTLVTWLALGPLKPWKTSSPN